MKHYAPNRCEALNFRGGGGLIKGRLPIANLRKTIIYITNVDLVNDNGYTKFGLIL